MPIVLADRRAPQSLRFGDAELRYYVASGDRILREIRRGAREAHASPADPDGPQIDAAVRLASEVVIGWSGVVDASDPPKPIPWPAEGAACGIAGVPEPTTADLVARVELLRLLPYNVLAELDRRIAVAWSEAVASGKGSPTGSDG